MRAARVTLVAHAPTYALKATAFPSPGDDLVELPRDDLQGIVGAGWQGVRGPEERCRETARLLGVEAATVEERLRDCDHGRWRGLPLAEVMAAEPEGVRQWLEDPDSAPHGGEPVSAVLLRVGEWLATLTPGRWLAVTHPGLVRAAVVVALGAPAGAYRRVDVPPLGRAELTGLGGRWNLRLPLWGKG